jgi:predicted PhzF superfamily epimerase YddE/YHI9
VIELHVLRVFVNEDREWGNALGVFVEGSAVAERERQPLAAELGFSETVFVEDAAEGRVHIHTPAVELPFAGHPLVGTAWLLAELGTPVEVLRPPAGDVSARVVDGAPWVAARSEWAPPFEYRRLATPADVRRLDAAAQSDDLYAWAWIDEAAGTIRARSFVPGAGIAEDEATGSAVLALSAQLQRPIAVHQGHGSVLLARPTDDGRAEVGGDVVLDEVRSA